MKWLADWSVNAQKFAERQSEENQKRILNAIIKLEQDPFRYLEHYEGKGYKYRIGDFRAIIEVDYERNSLFIRLLDRRNRIYN